MDSYGFKSKHVVTGMRNKLCQSSICVGWRARIGAEKRSTKTTMSKKQVAIAHIFLKWIHTVSSASMS